MNILPLAGIVISAGFVLYVAAMMVAPQLYQEPVIANRLAIITANQVRWNVSQLFFALGAGVPAVGFLLLAIAQRAEPQAWLYWLGAGAFATGSAIAMWLVYRQTLDPAAFWEGAQIPLLIGYGFLGPTLAGMFCLGIAMLQGSFPGWAGYLMAGSAVVFLLATVITRAQAGFFISILAYLVTFVAGIVVWRQ